MAAIALTEASVFELKKSLRDEFPEAKSAHITEALAFSLGFRTNAALQAALGAPDTDAPILLLDPDRMTDRLQELGYPPDPEFDFELMLDRVASLVSTADGWAYRIEYKSKRQKAWRNLMVSAVNAALAQKLFTLRPGDNRWPAAPGGGLFEFTLGNGLPALGSIHDAGYNELTVQAVVNPKERRLFAANAGFEMGDAVGTTWLERTRGYWMQSADDLFSCRRALLEPLVALLVEPLGYGDRGRVIM